MRFRSFSTWIILSVMLHLLIAGSVLVYNLAFEETKPPQVAIELVDLSIPPQVVRVRPKEQMKHQIVQQAETKNKSETPPETRFMSVQNQRVERETVAKNRGEFKNAKKTGQKDKPKLSDLTPKFDPLAIKEIQQTENGEGLSQSDDYLKDIQTGEQTMLNTREFRYYTYYSRIRRQLSHHWEPRVREKLTKIFRQGRRIASDKDHVTKLLIVLNHQGVLVKVQVVGASGVHDLDDAATEAFRSAAPFPNPPAGIVESDGYVKIRWDFVLES